MVKYFFVAFFTFILAVSLESFTSSNENVLSHVVFSLLFSMALVIFLKKRQSHKSLFRIMNNLSIEEIDKKTGDFKGDSNIESYVNDKLGKKVKSRNIFGDNVVILEYGFSMITLSRKKVMIIDKPDTYLICYLSEPFIEFPLYH